MSRLNFLMAAVLVAACISAGFPAFSQDEENPAEDNDAQPEEKQYLTVFDPTAIERNPEEYKRKDIQFADRFGERLSERDYGDMLRENARRALRGEGFSPRTHYIFRTHAITGSNMLCFASQENEEAKAFFEQALVSETPIYLMGQVGNRIFTEKGVMTLFMVDRLGVGTAPPKTSTVEKKKPIFFTIEYDVETATGTVRRKMEYKFKIPEPGKAYEIPDPYDRNRKLYMTFEF